MKIAFLSFALLVTSLLPARAETDFTRFLARPDFRVVEENSRPKIFPGGHDEKYWAEDAQGKLYKLRLKNALPNYAEIGGSVLSEAMGLPTLPVLPVTAKRGLNGIPSVEAAQALSPDNKFMGLSGSRGEWFSATLQPAVKLEAYQPAKLSGKQKAEALGQLLLNSITGNNDLQFGNGVSGNIGFADGHFYTLDSTQSFKFFDQASDFRVKTYFSLFEKQLGEKIPPAEQREIAQELNTYLSRLESLSHDEITEAFGPYFRAMKSFRDFKKLPDFDYAAELQRRIRGARAGAVDFFGGKFEQEVLAGLKNPLPTSRPKVKLPRALGPVPDAAHANPTDSLWYHYFQDFWKNRQEIEAGYAKQLSSTDGMAALFAKERAPKPRGDLLIEYLTDLEGNSARLDDFLAKSDVLTKDASGKWQPKPGTHFVYGGDTVDRAPGGMKILDFLADIKERHPDQVTLLLGNRDLNKMPLLEIANAADRGASIQEATELVKNKLAGLNAGGAYEFRRQELSAHLGKSATDEQVTKSLLDDIRPGGRMHRYLEMGEIGKVIDGNLFTHGLLTESNLGQVPGESRSVGDVRQALAAVNKWKEKELAAWAKGNGGEDLYNYQFPSDRSLVNSRRFDPNNNPLPTQEGLIKKLQQQGVHRILSGHTPQGNSPAIVRTPDFESIIGDNSYGSGSSASKIQLEGKETRIEGNLADGTKISSRTTLGKPSLIGQNAPGGYLVTGQFENGEYSLFKYLPGFKPEEKRVAAKELEAQLGSPAPIADCKSSFWRLGNLFKK